MRFTSIQHWVIHNTSKRYTKKPFLFRISLPLFTKELKISQRRLDGPKDGGKSNLTLKVIKAVATSDNDLSEVQLYSLQVVTL